MPRGTGVNSAHRVDARIITRQPAIQRHWLGFRCEIAYEQDDPEAIPPTDLIHTAEPIEIVETGRLQGIDCA